MSEDPTPNINETEAVSQLALELAAAYLAPGSKGLVLAQILAQGITLWNQSNGRPAGWKPELGMWDEIAAEQRAKKSDKLREQEGLPPLPGPQS